MIPTVPVTVNFADQNGHPMAGGKVSAVLTRNELYNGFVVPNQVTVVSDANGVAVLNLFPNQLGSQSSQYIFKLTQPGGQTLSVTGTVPNAACTLQSIVAMPASPAVPIGQVAVDTAIAAMGAASNSAAQALAIFVNTAAMQAAVTTTNNNVVTATAQAGIATTKAGEAAADVLLTHADVVTATAQAGIATTKAGEAAADVLLTHADVVTATAQAGIATTKAGEAAADVLLTHADVVTATAQAGIATTKAGEAAADVLLTHADVVTATAQAAAAALSAQHALVPSQALSANYTVLATDMGSVLMCTGPMTITFPAASAIGAHAVPIMVGNINIPNVTVAGLPALLDHMEFGQFEAFLSDGSSWRRMVGDSNSRVAKLRAYINLSPWSGVLTSDGLAPAALNQLTPPLNTAFEFSGRVVAKAISTVTQNQKSALWKIEGCGYVDATAGSLVLFAVTITNPTSNTTWSVSVTADLANGSVQIAFTGDQAVRLVAEIGMVMLP